MCRVGRLLLAAFLIVGGSTFAYGQESLPRASAQGSHAAKEKSESENAGEMQSANKPTKQEATEEIQPEPETKKPEAPPESGDDIGSHLEEAGAAEGQGEETAPGEEETPGEEKASPIKKTVKEEEHESGDNVGGNLEESREFQAGVLAHGPIEELHRLWSPVRNRLFDDTGISIGMAYTTLVQAAADGEDLHGGWGGDYDFFGKWSALNRDSPNTGSAGFLAEYRHRFTKIAPSDLNSDRDLGGLWRTTKGFGTHEFALVQLWWEQYLFDDHVKAVVGKLDPSNYYNGNRFQSQNISFLNPAFSGNPARAFPDNGLGVNVRVAPSDKMYLSFGVHDMNSTKSTSGFNHLDEDELLYAAEIGLTPRFKERGPGRYRFTGWHTGSSERTNGESGSGFALSFEQDFGNGLVPFVRYSYQGDGLSATKQIVAGGLGVLNPLGRKDDIFGIGFAWGQPVSVELRDQYVMELYYRNQLTAKIQLTPGFQVILDPSRNPDDDVIGIFELRVRVVF